MSGENPVKIASDNRCIPREMDAPGFRGRRRVPGPFRFALGHVTAAGRVHLLLGKLAMQRREKLLLREAQRFLFLLKPNALRRGTSRTQA